MMKIEGGRFRRMDQLERTRRSLRAEILALRRELELLEEVLRAGPTPVSARAALDHAFFSLRNAERTWLGSRAAIKLPTIVSELDEARQALKESLDALARRVAAAA